jgi:hypothetical protein
MRVKTNDDRELNLWEAAQIPFISLLGDIPAYFFGRHVARTAWHSLLYFFPDHLAIRKRLPQGKSIMGAIPPIPFDLADPKEIDFRQKRSGRLIFLKNGNDPDRLVQMWRDTMPAPTFLFLAELASELAAVIASDRGTDVDSMVTEAFAAKGWDVEACLSLRLLFIAQLDDYQRRLKSTMLARALLDFPVDIQGFNWDHVDFSGARARHLPGGDYVATGGQIRQALGIIDMSPNTRLAPHDRPLRAMGLHTFFLTNRQTYFCERFGDWRQFSFDFTEASIREAVSSVIANPDRYVELGRATAQQFNASSSPEQFGQCLADTASHVRTANMRRPEGFQEYFEWPPSI